VILNVIGDSQLETECEISNLHYSWTSRCHPERSARKEFPTPFFCDSPPHPAQMRRALGTPGRTGGVEGPL